MKNTAMEVTVMISLSANKEGVEYSYLSQLKSQPLTIKIAQEDNLSLSSQLLLQAVSTFLSPSPLSHPEKNISKNSSEQDWLQVESRDKQISRRLQLHVSLGYFLTSERKKSWFNLGKLFKEQLLLFLRSSNIFYL